MSSHGDGKNPAPRLVTGADRPVVRQAAPRPSVRTHLTRPVKHVVKTAGAYSRLYDRVRFDDRRDNARVLVAMLAGYKPELWPIVMPLFEASVADCDVCIISPGLYSDELAELCRRKGWSYLSTSTNDVSLAQNVCYRLHPAAEMIVKIDEDMFVLPDTISILLEEYRSIKREGVMLPGFLAPMIPLNGFCYRPLLVRLGLIDEFEQTFGRAQIGTSNLPVHLDPDIAQWIWERTTPLADTAASLNRLGRERLTCPIQFSIGLIVFERAFWESIGYLSVNRRRILSGISSLGGDEAYLCAAALCASRPAIVTTATVAGHFSFGPQYDALKSLLSARPGLFGGSGS